MNVFLVGGGTGGPTAPLIAVAEALYKKNNQVRFFLIGTGAGVEKKFIKKSAFPIEYLSIPAGKWRRYFSLMNIVDVFKVMAGFVKSVYLIGKYKPKVIFGAGSFVQVPLIWAGWLSGVPSVIHQQDVQILLSTKLVLPVVNEVSVSVEVSMKEITTDSGLFKKRNAKKIQWTGNPFRKNILQGSVTKARELFGLNEKYPTVLVFGGATGAEAINDALFKTLPKLVQYVQVIHIAGEKKKDDEIFEHEHYHRYEFLDEEMKHAYAAAELVIARAGMSTITELSALGKPAILIPLPKSPQVINARFLGLLHAAVALPQEALKSDILVQLIRKILWDQELIGRMKKQIQNIMPKDADQKIAHTLEQYLGDEYGKK